MKYGVNLLPSELQPEPPLEPKRLALISLITLVAGGLCVACIFWGLNFYHMRAELAAIQQQVPGLNETVARLEDLGKQRQTLEAEVGELERLVGERHSWSKMLLDLNKVVPGEVWLTALQLQAAGADQGTGQAAAGSAGTAGQKPGSVPSLLQGNLQQTGQLVTGDTRQQISAQSGASATVPAIQGEESGQQGQVGNQVRREDGNAIPPLPDTLTLKGNATSLAAVGVLIYQLGQLPYFSQVDLNEIKFDEAKGVTTFSISARLKGGGGG
ncbi:MAG: PilN domain-containing protein [Bacillota bacterium]|uniref:PilN domain-containing protein n=1 Tax=Desulforudis sp. DRI-14 TaxID=3459793 RepID=UPI003487D8E2